MGALNVLTETSINLRPDQLIGDCFKMPFKSCFVPVCSNTNKNCNKLFLCVPKDDRRKSWFTKINQVVSAASLYCCEDHFNLSEDADNWMFYKTVGQRLRFKKHVVPHLNLSPNKSPDLAARSQIKAYTEYTPSANNSDKDDDVTNRFEFVNVASIEKVFIEQKSIDEFRIKEERVDESSEEIITRDSIDGPNEEIVVKEEQADEYPDDAEVYDNLQLHMKCEVDEEKFHIPDQST